jgi:hypothetical protein
MNFVARYAQITTVVSYDHFIAETMPFPRPVELLVHVSVEPECGFADVTPKGEVLETIFKGFKSSQF